MTARSMRFSRRQALKAAAVTAGAAALPSFTGCGMFGKSEESKVVMGYGLSLVQLDPHRNENMVHESVLRNMYECLITFSRDLKKFDPQLATEWKRLDDKTTQFKLRPNVKFHNGEPFDAEAVKFSIHRMLDPKTGAPLLSTYTIIDHVDVIDSMTVNIVTKTPDPAILPRLTGFHTIIVPPKYFSTASKEDLATKPIGTGPYKFVSWAKDQDLVMEANKDYWGGAPKIQKVVVKGIPETQTRVSALLAGDVDIIPAVPPDDMDRISKSGKTRIASIPGNRIVFFALDCRSKPFDNKLVRQAVNYGANLDQIIKTVLGGNGTRVGTVLNPWYAGYEAVVQPMPYDPEKAKALLKQAGYPNGVEFTFYGTQGRVSKDKEVIEALVGELAKVGLKGNLKWLDWGTAFSQASAGKLDGIWFRSWGNFMHDADLSLFTNFHSTSMYAKVWQGYTNPKLDQLLEASRVEMDPAKRAALCTEIQKILQDDCPYLWGYAIQDIYGINNRIKWEPRTDEKILYSEMTLADQKA
ncbi:MAG TPA: ABC transporter substrate-binding protein [Candidatus Baltobacteraceae bacterium]|nr:ABC transporter substrate-binding protein [Candidatus Baltobacteraceae bacterium]